MRPGVASRSLEVPWWQLPRGGKTMPIAYMSAGRYWKGCFAIPEDISHKQGRGVCSLVTNEASRNPHVGCLRHVFVCNQPVRTEQGGLFGEDGNKCASRPSYESGKDTEAITTHYGLFTAEDSQAGRKLIPRLKMEVQR
jgi:hypothetical protein